jgi:AcrR family transcriptional regulator
MSRGIVGRGKSAVQATGQPGSEEPLRSRILTAAFIAFKQHGYAQASTLEIATRARVSKRELYAQFGNKQQMLVACISERARRMRLPADRPAIRDRQDLEKALAEFGAVLLREISDPDVIAVFRLAIAEADRSPEVAQALDAHGRRASAAALREMLEQARSAGLLETADSAAACDQFFALLLGDLVMSLALGLAERPGSKEIRGRAREAAEAFLQLHPETARPPGPGPHPRPLSR